MSRTSGITLAALLSLRRRSRMRPNPRNVRISTAMATATFVILHLLPLADTGARRPSIAR
jgi:hypothetical protein